MSKRGIHNLAQTHTSVDSMHTDMHKWTHKYTHCDMMYVKPSQDLHEQ